MPTALLGLCVTPAHISFASRVEIEATSDLEQTIVLLGLIWAAPLAASGMVTVKPIVERLVSHRYPATRRSLRALTIALVLVPTGIAGVLTQAFAGMMLSEGVPIFRSSADAPSGR